MKTDLVKRLRKCRMREEGWSGDREGMVVDLQALQNWVPLLFPPSHSLRNESVRASGKVSSCDTEEVGVSTSSQSCPAHGCSAHPSARSAEGVLEGWPGEGRSGEQAWLSQVHTSNGAFLVPSRNKLSHNPPSGPVLFTMELHVLWKPLRLLREAVSHYRYCASSACCEEVLHQQLLTSKFEKKKKTCMY